MAQPDDRPSIWAGHLVVHGHDLAASARFYEAIGMRPVATMDEVAIFELRGGTHLVVRRDPEAAGAPADFDLMVEDVAASHAAWSDAGLSVSPITKGPIHEAFTVTDPAGNTITVNSTHVMGPV